MLSAVKKISKRILRDFHELRFLQSSRKPLGNFINATVSKAEEVILEDLLRARPEFGVLSKYSSSDTAVTGETYWLVNVLDAPENFSRAMPYFSISLAVQQKDRFGNDEIVAGVVYMPALSELYFAEKGNGAWCEFAEEFQVGISETRLRISEKSSIHPIIFTNNAKFSEANSSVRSLGSNAISLVYLASGRGDKCIINYDDIFDTAAGTMIAKEAGAIVEDDQNLKRLVVKKAF